MNKIIFFILLSFLTFPCNFVNDGELFTRLGVSTIKELKYENKIICDDENEKLIYIYEDELEKDALLFGLEMNNSFLSNDYMKEINNSFYTIEKINTVITKKMNSLKSFGNNVIPEYIDYTFYVLDSGEFEEIFSLEFYLLDGAKYLYLNEKYKNKLDNINFSNGEIFWY